MNLISEIYHVLAVLHVLSWNNPNEPLFLQLDKHIAKEVNLPSIDRVIVFKERSGDYHSVPVAFALVKKLRPRAPDIISNTDATSSSLLVTQLSSRTSNTARTQ